MTTAVQTKKQRNNFALIMVVYLLGIFMGALDTGIVTPARTVIQDSLGVGDTTGIWMITIYTLAYASSIPVMGKLADRMGRRTIYLIAIALFGGGSFMCGISHSMNSFTALLISRAVQAIGGGGIVPVANAEFGTTFPEEKRGMALGMVGGVYGIANIFGASAGSLILDMFGTDRWEYIFYVNVPIAIFILIAGFFALPNNKEKATTKLDGLGTCVLVVMVLCIMYGLKNIDFFNFTETIASKNVYPFLLAFCLMTPFFVMIERKAEDPVLNLKYFTNPRILVTLVVSTITGIVMMGVIFIPQLCENAMQVPTGTGGYFVIALGLCAGIGAPFSGKLTDKFGPKLVLGFGFLAAILGALVIINFTTVNPARWNVFAALGLIGLSIGFTMGAPLNYMMLWEVPDHEANSALATLSLVRSLGTVVAPAIMVGFIVHAAAGIQDNIMAVLPTEINVPELPYAEELTDMMKDRGMDDMPDLADMQKIEITMEASDDSDFELPKELIDELKNSDVTTITDSVVHMSEFFFDEMTPGIQEKINGGIDSGIEGMDSAIAEMDQTISDMKKGQAGIQQGIDGISDGINKQQNAVNQMKKGREGIQSGYDGIQQGIDGIQSGIDGIQSGIDQMSAVVEKLKMLPESEETTAQIEQMEAAMAEMQTSIDEMKAQQDGMKAQQDEMQHSMDEMDAGINALENAMKKMKQSRSEMQAQKAKLGEAISGISSGKEEIAEAIRKMKELKAAIPGAFEAAEEDYIEQVRAKDPEIRKAYQDTLGVGFKQMYMMTGITSAVGILLLAMYRRKKEAK